MVIAEQEKRARAALIGAALDFLTVADVGGFTGEVVEAGDIAWENVIFDPSGKLVWCSVFYRPNLPDGRTIGFGGFDQLTGFLQIDFNTPQNSGEEKLIAWEAKARLYFPAGSVVSSGTQNVTITRCGMSQGRNVENYFRKSLTVEFTTSLKRAQ